MIFDYIERLRHASVAERRRAAVLWTAIIVGIIGLAWLVSLLWRFGFLGHVPVSDPGVQNTHEIPQILPPY